MTHAIRRFSHIFFLHFQYVFERRAVSFVWFLISLFNPLIVLLYWQSALRGTSIAGWSLSTVSSYYFLLIIASAMLMSHIEDDVSREDIEQGQLVRYIIRPFSYYWINFIREIPYRLLQGSFGMIVCLIFISLWGRFFTIASRPEIIAISLIIAVLAYVLSFTFKMVLGLTAFWLTDANGFYQLVEIVVVLFAGYILPLDLMPDMFSAVARCLPFAYIIYFPVVALQGKLTFIELLQTIGMQLFWLAVLAVLYRWMWQSGIKKFTGMGQ